LNLFVTITGADDATDPHQLAHLSRFYRFVEWGVLFSEKRRGSPRYPSLRWIRALEDLARDRRLFLSMHLCGAEARAAVARPAEFWPGAMWRRVQINGYEPGTANEQWRRSRYDLGGGPDGFRWILQARSEQTIGAVWKDALAADAYILYDPSGGEGRSQTSWPKMPAEDSLSGHGGPGVGFAGGIDPDNVEEVLRCILSKNAQLRSVWIDMESGVRTDDKLDSDKVRAVLDVVARFR
jgi:phosphoribosylanthranilate isomerase